jgi:hypothetical protein
MSCDCGQCRQHYRTLGIAFGIPEESAIEEAYREAVKQWHPDLYENYASLRADAEEHFKQIQVAFRELKEHNAAVVESPVESVAIQTPHVGIQPNAGVQPREEAPAIAFRTAPSISFGDAPGCLVAPHFTPEAEEMIAQHLGKIGAPLAIVDLTGARSLPRNYAQFLLLTELGIMVRDARKIVSLLWFRDLGEINLIDKQKPGKPGIWQSLFEGGSGSQSRCVLEIYRNNGTLFYSLSGHADDSAKRAIYDFLHRKKNQSQPLARE